MIKQVTLSNLSESTEQEVFDWVVSNLLKQNKQSEEIIEYNGLNSCRYRSKDGLKCAAGWLMTDKEYNPKYEENSWNSLILDHIEIPRDHSELISELQDIHDNSFPDRWRREFKELATDYNLEYKFGE